MTICHAFAMRRLAFALLAVLVVVPGCGLRRLTRKTTSPSFASAVDSKSRYLKAHMNDGGIYVLTNWRIEPDSGLVRGEGRHLDPNRSVLAEGAFSVPLDSVALFESNVVSMAPQVAGMMVITGLSAALTVYCLSNPKACFGSCPTFYVSGEKGPVLRAEGFSSSVAPSLEATDLDALHRTARGGSRIAIEMRNEALETHVVRQADLIAVPLSGSERILANPDGSFHRVGGIAPPIDARGREGRLVESLSHFDGRERWSPADSSDLASREEIELQFEVPGTDSLCILIAARQTLLSTYVFYQSLAWMGSEATAWLARLERGDSRFRATAGGASRLLGGVDVLVPDSMGAWEIVGSFDEIGPLATDMKAIPLPPGAGRSVRLRLARGHWRLDWVAIGRVEGAAGPVRIPPSKVVRNGSDDAEGMELLLDPERSLVTFPGDTVTLWYDVPGDMECELFLESRGYYLEWIRDEWLAEENPWLAARLFLDPSGALRALAPKYKRVEADVEDVFWNSRFAKP